MTLGEGTLFCVLRAHEHHEACKKVWNVSRSAKRFFFLSVFFWSNLAPPKGSVTRSVRRFSKLPGLRLSDGWEAHCWQPDGFYGSWSQFWVKKAQAFGAIYVKAFLEVATSRHSACCLRLKLQQNWRDTCFRCFTNPKISEFRSFTNQPGCIPADRRGAWRQA